MMIQKIGFNVSLKNFANSIYNKQQNTVVEEKNELKEVEQTKLESGLLHSYYVSFKGKKSKFICKIFSVSFII